MEKPLGGESKGVGRLGTGGTSSFTSEGEMAWASFFSSADWEAAAVNWARASIMVLEATVKGTIVWRYLLCREEARMGHLLLAIGETLQCQIKGRLVGRLLWRSWPRWWSLNQQIFQFYHPVIIRVAAGVR